MLIGAVIMAKNEELFIQTTIESVKNEVDGIILYDTGSTDNTIAVVKDLTEKYNLRLHLLEGAFVDFATSRNSLLRFADTLDYDYLLLLDANDELVTSASLKSILTHHTADAFLVQQKWFSASETNQYFNIRLIKPNKGFMYEGVVHEFLNTGGGNATKIEGVCLFQDRTVDDTKSCRRWETDVVLLEKAYSKDPENSRTQYYLAQTYDCLRKFEEARRLYEIRADNTNGFQEERFIAMMRLGKLSSEHDRIKWFFRAYFLDRRAEPLVEISKIFRKEREFRLSFHTAKTACLLEYPSNRLFLVNKQCYDHDRWQEVSISAYYAGELEEGKAACLKCIESGYDKGLNESNLKFYTI
jgi:glycosyltransferase involved in cell wall biosynthesis